MFFIRLCYKISIFNKNGSRFLNIAFIGESNKKTNNFLLRLLQLYSNNLPKNNDFDIDDLGIQKNRIKK